MGWTTVGNIRGPQGLQGDPGTPGDPGPKGDPGTSVSIKGTVANAAALPGTAADGDGYITQDDGHLHVWGDGAFTDVGTVRGPQGPAGTDGTAATVSVGTTTTGAAGTSAVVTQGGTAQARIFDFVIPQGTKGDPGTTGAPGTAATVSVLSTSTGTPGSNATVAAGGTPQAVTLAFTIPRGDAGTNGTDGAPGARGSEWFSGSGAPPASIPGSLPNDIYLDLVSGAVYRLS